MRVLTAALMLLTASLSVLAAPGDPNLTPAATVTTRPEVAEGRVGLLMDGSATTGFAFEVGTKGEGWVSFDFGAPRAVTGLRFIQHSEVYYTTEYVIEGDSSGDGTYNVTLAEGSEAKINEWNEHHWAPVEVQTVRLRSVTGVSGGKRAHPCLAEVEILGPALAGDAVRAHELGNPVSSVAAARTLSATTPLVIDEQPPMVVAGTGEAAAAAKALARGLTAVVGAPVQVVETLEEAGLGERTIIAVGNCVTNPLVARLYYNWYAWEDNLYPGPGGYTLRTVTDPYPWRGDTDVIVIGGSDTDGLSAGVARLLALATESPDLPRLLEIKSAAAPTNAEVRAEVAKAPPPTFAAFLDAARAWQRWGREEHAQRAISVLEMMAQTYERDPSRDIPWNEETKSGPIFAAWEAFETCPLLTDDQRLRFSRAFLKLLYSIPQHTSGYAKLEQSRLVAWNHTTFPLMGLYFGGRYFQRYHHITVCDDYLEKAHACMRAQARSWKPQEDADSYVKCTMDHAVRYCMAEGLDEFVTDGVMGRYADYMIGICDSRGWAGGFGDSHYSSNSGLLQGILPLAYLATGDPAYRWTLEHVAPEWENPYSSVPGERPDRFVGMNVFPLDPQVHEYTQTYSYYNEPHAKSEVAPERAWDKISFRESWDPDAQYLLMDGFGRGKHLHYDTNCITEYVADGERWLVDHDYLVRNSTEHCMLTVLREGRGDALVPSMSELVSASDMADWSVACTRVPGYAGLDWDRAVIWRKGRYFVALDGVIAREPGEYDLELTWKTEDQDAQRLEAGRVFVADRGAVAAKTSDVIIAEHPEASGGRDVIMGGSTSRLAMRLELPAGEYGINLRGTGSDGSHDSVWVRVDGGDPVALGLRQGGYGGALGGGTAPQAKSTITIPEGDVHVMLVTLRELPPARLDRFVFLRDGEEVLVVETEDAEALRPDDGVVGETKRFHIKSAEFSSCRMTTHESQGISIPLSVLHQRRHEKLAAGEGSRFASIFYDVSARRTSEFDLGRLGDGRYRVTGDDNALIAVNELSGEAIRCLAQVIIVEPGRISLTGGTLMELGSCRWASEEPRNVQVDLATGAVTIHGPDASSGGGPLAIGDAERALISGLLAAEPEYPAPTSDVAEAELAQPRWRYAFPEGGEVRRLQTADLDGDGVLEVLVAQGRWCHCLELDGTVRWSFPAENTILDIADVQCRPDAGREVAVASADTHIYVLSAGGQLLDQHQPLDPPHSQTFGDRPWPVYVIDGIDLDADGSDELVASLGNYQFIAFDQDWSRPWQYGKVAHGAMDIKLGDRDGDGADEIFVADKYGFVHGITREGRRAFIGYSSIGNVQFDLADLTGEGKLSVIYGSSTGDLLTRGPDGGISWRLDNYGYAVRRICAADLDADGTPEVLVASDTGYLYALDHEGAELWRDRLGFAVNDVIVEDVDGDGALEVIATGEDGLVRYYRGDGTVVRTITTAAAAGRLCAVKGPAAMQVLIATADGAISAY